MACHPRALITPSTISRSGLIRVQATHSKYFTFESAFELTLTRIFVVPPHEQIIGFLYLRRKRPTGKDSILIKIVSGGASRCRIALRNSCDRWPVPVGSGMAGVFPRTPRLYFSPLASAPTARLRCGLYHRIQIVRSGKCSPDGESR